MNPLLSRYLRRAAVRKNLELRHKMTIEVRKYLDSKGFIEVETPLLIRISSPPSVLSSIVKGGVKAEFSTFNSDTMISISPVGIFLFLLKRSLTVPTI